MGPCAGEESGHGKLERLALDGGELGGERGERLVPEVPRDFDGRLQLHRDNVRERAEPHASRGVGLEALRHRLREGEVAKLELDLTSRERLAVASAQLHRKAVRAAAEERLEDAVGRGDAAAKDAADRRRYVDVLPFARAPHLAGKRERRGPEALRDGEGAYALRGVGQREVLDAPDGERLRPVRERHSQHRPLDERERRGRSADC